MEYAFCQYSIQGTFDCQKVNIDKKMDDIRAHIAN